MSVLANLLEELDENTIAQKVGIPHDEARIRYSLTSNTVTTFSEFEDAISHYYNYHYTQCVTRGGNLPRSESYGRAREIIEQGYRRRGGDITSAYNDAHAGTNGGLRAILDIIAETLKEESVTRHVRHAFDQHVAPNDYEAKVAIIREFIVRCGPYLSKSIQTDRPERYAQNYQDLIHAYVMGLQNTSSIFRRL